MGEGDNIIGHVFDIIKDLDDQHYLEMEELASL